MIILRKIFCAIAHQRLHHFLIGIFGREKEVRVLSSPHIYGFSPVNPVGVHDNPASLGLTEDPRQPHHRNPPGGYDILQHISRSHAWQLVRISHQNQCHLVRKGFQKIVHEHHIYHGALIQNQHVAFQGMFLVFLIPFRGLVFQKPVNGLCFHACGLGHPFRRPSGGRRQQNPAARHLIGGNNAFHRGGLSRSRPSGQHHNF